MGCRHGCEPSYGWNDHCNSGIDDRDWYQAVESQARGRRAWRWTQADEERATVDQGPATLEARLDQLQAELGRIGAMLADMRGSGTGASGADVSGRGPEDPGGAA